jgi:hypothetical protein
MSNPVLRTASLHAATFVGGMTAAIAFMASHAVDLYSIYDQLNTTIADISKLLAVLLPIVSGAYGAYRATTASKVQDIAASQDTDVSADGTTITLLKPKLAEAAKEASVPPKEG